jgi:hypothetical protein
LGLREETQIQLEPGNRLTTPPSDVTFVNMKSIWLRTLVGKPLKAKHSIRSGAGKQSRGQAVDELFDQVLRESKSSISLSRIIKESRR